MPHQSSSRHWRGIKGPWTCRVPRGAFVVYQLLDTEGHAIYVGQTNRLADRLRAHRAPGSRTNAYATWTATEYPDRTSALKTEARAIAVLRPPLNRAGV